VTVHLLIKHLAGLHSCMVVSDNLDHLMVQLRTLEPLKVAPLIAVFWISKQFKIVQSYNSDRHTFDFSTAHLLRVESRKKELRTFDSLISVLSRDLTLCSFGIKNVL
jgi:hypothetical protein